MSYSPLGRTSADQFYAPSRAASLPVGGDSRSASLPPPTGQGHRHEPEETQHRADPVNGLLDLFEAQVRLLLDHGAEVALRTRLTRLLPPLLPVASDSPAGSLPEATEWPAASKNSADRELEIVALIADCARFEKFKMSAASHACVGRIKARAAADLEAAKLARTAQ